MWPPGRRLFRLQRKFLGALGHLLDGGRSADGPLKLSPFLIIDKGNAIEHGCDSAHQVHMDPALVVAVVGWFFNISAALGVLLSLAFGLVKLFRKSRPPQIIGAELPVLHASIDLGKRYDIVYGASHGAGPEKLTGVRILGYLRSHRDETTGEYMESGWLVVELPDRRRAYLRPRSVLWLLEATDVAREDTN